MHLQLVSALTSLVELHFQDGLGCSLLNDVVRLSYYISQLRRLRMLALLSQKAEGQTSLETNTHQLL